VTVTARPGHPITLTGWATRSEDGIAVQRAEDALHQRVTGIDRGRVGAEGFARLPEDRSDDGHDLATDVLLCREEIAALRTRVRARLDADDPVLPQVEVCIEDAVGIRHGRLTQRDDLLENRDGEGRLAQADEVLCRARRAGIEAGRIGDVRRGEAECARRGVHLGHESGDVPRVPVGEDRRHVATRVDQKPFEGLELGQ
jgi:hypothetical protein